LIFLDKIRNINLGRVGKEIKRTYEAGNRRMDKLQYRHRNNRFLAKLGASLHKPDGLDVITHENLLDVYKNIELIDLCGINKRFEARLNFAGIFTPLDFFQCTSFQALEKVFQSIGGYYWYMRLRGWEIDQVGPRRQSFGSIICTRGQDPR